MYSDEQASEMLQRLTERYQRRTTFAGHAVVFACFALASSVFLLDPPFWRRFMTLPNTGDVFLILVVWSSVFAAHTARFYLQEAGDRAVERAMGYFDRPQPRKRKSYLLDNDGDIV
jgi:hypothetical protein